MPSTVDLIAIVTPKAGKADRIVELISTLVKWVEANEPNTLKYELKREVNKKTGVECLILVESYSDMAALKAHGASETFAAFQKAMLAEGLAGAPAQLKFVKPVAGFSRL